MVERHRKRSMRSLSGKLNSSAPRIVGELFARKVCLTRLFVVSCSRPLCSIDQSPAHIILPYREQYPRPRQRHAYTAAAHAPPGCKKLSFDLWHAALEGTNEAPPRMPPAPGARVLPSEGLPEGTLISRGDTAAAHRMIPWNGSCKNCVFYFS